MSFWTYILRCSDGHFYTGHTDDIDKRIAQHQTGGYCDFTSRRRPIALVWSETFQTRIEALEAERRIKPWSRAKKEALIARDWEALSFYARPPRERPSTSLGTSGEMGNTASVSNLHSEQMMGTERATPPQPPLVRSEVEGRP